MRTALNVTGDDLTDLFVAREDGIWFYINSKSGFVGERISFTASCSRITATISCQTCLRQQDTGVVEIY